MSKNNRLLYGPWIKELLKNNGPMGVQSIARQLDLPPASVQHFLTKQQKELVQLDNKKWSLPPTMEELFEGEDLEFIKNASLDELISAHRAKRAAIKHAQKEADFLYYYIRDIVEKINRE